MNKKSEKISEMMKLPESYYAIIEPKQQISDKIMHALNNQNLTLIELANQIDGANYEDLVKVTAGEEYSIDTLLKVLYALEIKLKLLD